MHPTFKKFPPLMIAVGDAVAVPLSTDCKTKLVELQLGDDLEICEVQVGTVSLKPNPKTSDNVRPSQPWEGREVESDVKITAIVKNVHPNEVKFVTGGWFFEVEKLPEASAPTPMPNTPTAPVETNTNPHPFGTHGAQPIYPGANEVAVCLTTEQVRRTLYVLKGGMLHPIEVAGIMGPFERALRNVGLAP